MTSFIQNILWNSVEGFVEAGTRTMGGYAGDALIKAGDMVENSGRSVGNGLERKFTNYGSAISGQTYQPSPKPLPSTARKPAIKRSNSSPASSKPTAAKSLGPTSSTPIGANKYPGGKQAITAKKTVSNGVTGAKGSIGGVTGGAVKKANSVVGGAQKSLPKPYPNNVPYGTKYTPPSAQSKTSGITSGKGVAESKVSNLSKPYGSNSFSSSNFSSGKRTAVKAGKPRPFENPDGKKDGAGAKAYPGTNTLPGQGSRTPVKKQYKPAQRLGSQVEEGKKMTHISI